jgi:flagellar biosynthesis regulator FlaF
MCVIAVYDTNYPTLEDLESMESMNKDGSGIAWRENGKIHYKKGINLKAKDIYDIIQEKQIKFPFIVHFRIKSSGLICDELCHPFPISKKSSDKLENICDKVLFHNGTVYKYDDYMLTACLNSKIKVPDGELSDSKVLAYLCAYYGDNFLRLVGGTSRFIVFDMHGIQKFGDWVECSNGLCSNDNHVEKPKTDYAWTNWNKKPELTQREIENIPKIENESIEKIRVNNTGMVNVWSQGKLLRIENENGKVIHDFDKNESEMNSILDEVDKLQISEMTNEQQKELYSKTTDEIEKIDNRLDALHFNIKMYEMDVKDDKNRTKAIKKIKSSRKRIEALQHEKGVKILIIDDLMNENDDLNKSLDEMDEMGILGF